MPPGPYQRVEGPRPSAPPFGLVASATNVIEPDSRWENGIVIDRYPCGTSSGFDECADDSPPKESGGEPSPLPQPEFRALTVYHADSCSSIGLGPTREFTQRLELLLESTQHRTIEREFEDGAITGNPALRDPTATVLNLGNPTDIISGLAFLEQAIADSGRSGFIHVPVASFVWMSRLGLLTRDSLGRMRTPGGNIVVRGTGYTGLPPVGQPPLAAGEEFLYATGPVEIRMSGIEIMPRTISEALDRAENRVVFRAERRVISAWDLCLHAAVRVDLCIAGL